MFIQLLEEKIAVFIRNSPENLVNELGGMPIFDQPLLGVAEASDPLWQKLKEPEVVGAHHLTPQEWLPGAMAVISYFLPYTEHVRSSNRPKGLPSKEWLYGRYEGEMFNNALRRLIVGAAVATGVRALVPVLDQRFTVTNRRSNWSERHVAFIAGLGTFCLNRSLITSLGTAGRFGSVILDLELEPKPRRYHAVDEYCTKCGACIDRCPPRAITEKGKDNAGCSQYLDRTLELFNPRYGCGKCQTAVPCEYRNPGHLGSTN